jgi:hypothetical protein
MDAGTVKSMNTNYYTNLYRAYVSYLLGCFADGFAGRPDIPKRIERHLKGVYGATVEDAMARDYRSLSRDMDNVSKAYGVSHEKQKQQ